MGIGSAGLRAVYREALDMRKLNGSVSELGLFDDADSESVSHGAVALPN